MIYYVKTFKGFLLNRNIVLFSLATFVISLVATYFLNNIFTNTIIKSEKKKLLAVASASSSHVKGYFNALENTVITVGSIASSVDALLAFKESFYEIENEVKYNKKHEKSLIDYYKKSYINKINTTLDISD